MLRSLRRPSLWLVLLACSTVIHAVVSWRIGQQIEPVAPLPPTNEVQLIMTEPPPIPIEERPPPPEEQLEFEDEFDLEPPEILIAPKAVAPPPPDVTTAMRAQSGGFQGIEVPSGLGAVPLAAGRGVGGFKTGIGNGLGDGSARFAAYIAGLREAGLDVVFAIDATGSMDWVIQDVKEHVEDMAQIVRTLVPIARFGIVAYRDKDDPHFTTRLMPLTYSTSKVVRFLNEFEAKGGGDMYEAIDLGIKVAVEEANWRPNAKKLIIVVGDAPMRWNLLPRVERLAEAFRRRGGTLSTLDVSDQANPEVLEAKVGRKVNRALYTGVPMFAFRMIAEAGQGDAATLGGETKLSKRLITLVMGDRFATEMRALLDVL